MAGPATRSGNGLILAIDTSTAASSVALAEGGRCVGAFQLRARLTHSRWLMPAVELLLAQAGVRVGELAGLAVAVGPGSFTGLRIGLATAKGLAWATGLEVAAVPTLTAYATHLLGRSGVFVPVLDARRGQVYSARFLEREGRLERLTPDAALAPEEAFAVAEGEPLFFGEATVKYRDVLERIAGPAPRVLDDEAFVAAAVARVGTELLAQGQGMSAAELGALYVRRPAAVVEGERVAG